MPLDLGKGLLGQGWQGERWAQMAQKGVGREVAAPGPCPKVPLSPCASGELDGEGGLVYCFTQHVPPHVRTREFASLNCPSAQPR